MRKALISFGFLVILLFSLFAQEEHRATKITFTYGKTVEVGFSEGMLDGFEKPSGDDLPEISFSYNPDTGMIESDTFYVYALAYVTDPIKLSLYTSGELESEETEETVPFKSNQHGGSPYFTSETTQSNPYVILDEEPGRVYSARKVEKQYALFIDPKEIPLKGNDFRGIIYLKVEKK